MQAEHIPSRPEPRPGSGPFRLTQFVSLTSLIGSGAVTACPFRTYRELTERHLVEHQSRVNADLTRAFAHAVRGRYRSTCDRSSSSPLHRD